MHVSSEAPLLIFTLTVQLAVGIMQCGWIASIGSVQETVKARIGKQSYFALLFMCVGGLFSLLHLGTPGHAVFTLTNVGTSWLSREILMVLLMTAAVAACAFIRYRDTPGSASRVSSFLTAILGLALLYAMSKVYDSPFLPGWEGSATFFLFLASALIMGGVWLACAIGFMRGLADQEIAGCMWRLFFCATAGFALAACFAPASLPDMQAGFNPVRIGYPVAAIATWQGTHVALCGLGLLLLGYALWRLLRERTASAYLVLALALCIAGEIAGRSAFYMSYARLGM